MQYETSQQHGTVVQVAQTAALKQRRSNRAVILKLIKCTYFLVKNRIAHTTNFSNLVELVSSCGAEDLQCFTHDEVQRNAKYTSSSAVTDFISAIASFIRSKLLASISRSKFFTLMADECTDVSSTEELSNCCRWLENGKPVEHFIDIIHITEMKAAAITTVLTEFMSSHGIDVRQMRGMGFDGAATFSGKKSGVQTRLKNLSPHAIYLHCRNHILQLACVQAANTIPSIKKVYSNFTSLWKLFYYSPKKAEKLKEVQNVLDLPQLKLLKPTDTRWLSHENTVRSVRKSYTAIVPTLETLHNESGDAEAYGLAVIFKRLETVATIYMLSEVLGIVGCLCRALQTKDCDLVQVPIAVNSTLTTLAAIVEASRESSWYTSMRDQMTHLQEAGIALDESEDKFEHFNRSSFVLFVTELANHITRRFSDSQDLLSAFSVFDHNRLPVATDDEYRHYGEDSLITLCQQYGITRETTSDGRSYTIPADVDRDLVVEECATFKSLLGSLKGDMKERMREVLQTSTYSQMFPNICILLSIFLVLPVSTATVERSFSAIKTVKTQLRNRLSDDSSANLMLIAIEGPEDLSDEDLDTIATVWSKAKPRAISI